VLRYYSHGKLLLTGEYAVLDGAKSLAFPTKYGQALTVQPSITHTSEWVSYLADKTVWNRLGFTKDDIVNAQNGTSFSSRLLSILKCIYLERQELFSHALKFSTHLEFDKNWGLGSSSTLINNLSLWAELDSYRLLSQTFGGSGYDIAAANSKTPIIFQKEKDFNKVIEVEFSNNLKPYIYFVYLNQKQNSREGIRHYKSLNRHDKKEIIDEISLITEKVLLTENVEEFEILMKTHEQLVSRLTQQTPVQDLKFSDYNQGIVKSLGAWGGDFVLVTAKDKEHLDYFSKKGYNTIFRFSDLILD
jgi:mevalonate kinase